MLSIIGFYRREILEELFKFWTLDAIKNKVENPIRLNINDFKNNSCDKI